MSSEQQTMSDAQRDALAAVDALVQLCEKVVDESSSAVNKTEFAGFLTAAQRQFHRHILRCSPGSEPPAKRAHTADAAPLCAAEPTRTVRVEDTYAFRPIARVRTPFRELNGTPRQATYATTIPAVLEFEMHVQPNASLLNLEDFSHLWLISIFHANTNRTFHPKVSPPLLEGAKTGVFATRSPHRPNPIALSLCEIESVDLKKGKVFLRGTDLVDGTPIIDIKPFVRADVLEAPRWPSWIDNERLENVVWKEEAKEQLAAEFERNKRRFTVFKTLEEMVAGVENVLKLDIRSVHAKHKHTTKVYGVCLENLNFVYTVSESDKTCTVTSVAEWHK